MLLKPVAAVRDLVFTRASLLMFAIATIGLLCGPANGSHAAGVADESVEVKVHSNIAYRPRESGEIIPLANMLDVYTPQSNSKLPVVLLVHGGAWIAGDKLLDFIPMTARKLAKEGFVVVAVNYRLSPLVQHPAHIHDVAKALAWTVANIEQYGGQSDAIFLLGHSAGGHLVSLLATAPQYAQSVGVPNEIIRGVVSISGVYHISELTIDTMLADRSKPSAYATATSPFAVAFGTKAEVWREASPQNHVREGLPPFLIVTASYDLPTLATMAENFDTALKEKRVETQLIKAKCRTHATGFWRMAIPNDATFVATRDFLHAHSR